MESCELIQMIKCNFAALLLAMITVPALPAVAQSTSDGAATDTAEVVEETEYPDLTGNGTPRDGQRAGMGSRGCGIEGVRAVVPESNLALVGRESPSLWLYLPYESGELQSLELRIWDEAAAVYIYETEIAALPQSAGFVGVTLPEGRTLLTEGKSYKWELMAKFSCTSEITGEETDGSDFLEGVIQRVADQDTGYDAISRAGMERCLGGSSPEWTWLLKLIGYEAIAAEPVVDCLTPEVVQAATE